MRFVFKSISIANSLYLTFTGRVAEYMYRVFFIEGQIRIGYKMLKKLLFHVGFGFRMEVTMGYLISDQFKTHF